MVAPLAGAWIEIGIMSSPAQDSPVAPLAGAWIEIIDTSKNWARRKSSLPSRERGLKYRIRQCRRRNLHVAPLAGAWIEIEERI